MEPKNKRQRRAYLDDFHRNAAGDYVYEGVHFVCATRRALLRRLWPCAVALGAATVLSGCLDAPGMANCFWLILPYIAEVAAAGSVWWALCRFTAGGERLRDYVYRAAVLPFGRRALLTAVTGGVGLVAEGVYLLLYGAEGRLPAALALLALKLVVMAAAMTMRALMRRAVWRDASDKT